MLSKNLNKHSEFLSKKNSQEIKLHLVEHSYNQLNIAIFTSAICMVIFFFEIQHAMDKHFLPWLVFYGLVTIFRLALVLAYKIKPISLETVEYWKQIYTVGAYLGGFAWGLSGFLIFSHATATQQTFILMMLGGITAGAITVSAAIPHAAFGFVFSAMAPYFYLLYQPNKHALMLIDLSMVTYFVYLILLTRKTYQLIYHVITLKCQNEVLVISLENTNKQLQIAATHDPLTQIPNRRLFEEKLKTTLAKAKENNAILALFYIDLDHFKTVNDTYGHEAGDFILVTAITRLKEFFRKTDLIARLGGDELAIITEDIKTKGELTNLAHKICTLLAKPIIYQTIPLHISASVGISLYPWDGSNEETLLSISDKCMYKVKKQGGNNFHYNEPMQLPI